MIDRLYAELVGMGFDGAAAIDAARRCSTVEEAVNLLLTGDVPPAEAARQPAASAPPPGIASASGSAFTGGGGSDQWQKVRDAFWKPLHGLFASN